MTYSSTGSTIVDAEDLTNEAVLDSVTSALLQELDIHPSNIDVSYNPETGVVTYIITSDDVESLANMMEDIEESGFEEALPFDSQSHELPENIVVSVEVTVDASNVSDVDTVLTSVTSALEEQNESYGVSGDGKGFSFSNTFWRLEDLILNPIT